MPARSRRTSADGPASAAWMGDGSRPSGREWLIRGLFAVLVAALALVVTVTLLTTQDDAATTEGWGSGSNGPAGGVHPAWTSSTSP